MFDFNFGSRHKDARESHPRFSGEKFVAFKFGVSLKTKAKYNIEVS